MTSDVCNLYLQQVTTTPLGLEADAGNQKNKNSLLNRSNVFSIPVWDGINPLDGDGTGWVCKKGFDDAFGQPLSKGGKYVTLDDINAILGIGIEYGKWKAKGGYSIASHTGTYQYSIFHSKNGKRMIRKKKASANLPPDDGKTTNEWASLRPKPTFRPVYNSATLLADKSENITQTSKPNVTVVLLGRLISTYGGVYQFSHLFHVTPVRGQDQYWCTCFSHGTVRMIISEYNDIYTNPDHANEYIIVGMGYCENKNSERQWTPILMPLKPKKSYYVYLEYDDNPENQFARSFYIAYPDKMNLDFFKSPDMHFPWQTYASGVGLSLNYISWAEPNLLASQWDTPNS